LYRLKTVSQEIKAEDNEMTIRLENAQNEIITSLRDMNLVADRFKHEIQQSNEK
jgi:hypothetical protein